MSTLAWAADDSKVLNVYNWSDYVGENTIRDFEKETGIKVNYDTFDSNEALYAKLRAGHTGYDIVVPSSHWAKRQIEGHLLLKLDKSKITTYGNLDPWLMGELAVSAKDPGNNYVVPWLWGLSTVGINVDKVKAALGPLPMPENAWDLIFKPEYASRLTSCGLSLLDSGDEVFPAALHYLGRPGFSHDRADYEAAARLLKAMRPYVTLFSSSGYINGLADGSLCAVFGWSGDIAIAGQRAKEAHNGQKIIALVPKTGAYMFFDTMAIPVDAPHVENAYKWISYIYRPQVQAGIVNKVLHANPVRAADKLLNPDVRSSSSVFFKTEELAHVAPPEAIPDDMLRVRTRLFTAFKTGQ
jgi:putrescine transport system substrate-binding protein